MHLSQIIQEYLPHGVSVCGSRTKGLEIIYPVKAVVKRSILTPLDFFKPSQYTTLGIDYYKLKPLLKPLNYLTNNDALAYGYNNLLEFLSDINTGDISVVNWKVLVSELWDVYDLYSKGLAIDLIAVSKRDELKE